MFLGAFRVPDIRLDANFRACDPVFRHSLQVRKSKVRSNTKNGCKSYAEAAPVPDLG